MKKYLTIIVVAFLLIFVGAALMQDPEEARARYAKEQQDKQKLKDQAEERTKAFNDGIAELSGTKCTKDGKAMIGEHQARTLKCGWGKPERVNRTITGNTTREQWVYGNRNYLYFVDGVLTSIQN